MQLFKDAIGLKSRKERPYGTISSKGQYNEMMENAKKIANDISTKAGVIGITLCGGLSRGYADELSEIDLNIYLEDDVYNDWITGMGPLPHSDALWNDNYIDIEFLSFDKEFKEEWDLIKKWDASYNVILYDPEDKIKALLNKKDVFSSQEKFHCLSKAFGKCMYIGNLVVLQWINRGDPISANQLITNALLGLTSLVFLANDEYPPYEKWALNYSYSLKWLPKDWKKRVSEVLLTKEISIKEAERRRALFIELYKDCWEKVVGKESRDLELIDLISLRELQFIIDNSPVSFEKFADSFDIKHLSYEPIYKFTNIIIKENMKFIYFNHEKFIEQKAANFPEILEWSKLFLNKLKLPQE
ncbi:MAG: nucleotidyltransferase domain-containing protein [Promethearchaeota archaeon]